MREAIERSLVAVEAERSVRILFACEAGSRAWGFASPDSDYDVRFVYLHDVDWYLRVSPGRDSIEQMLPGDLDLSGWELRKALSLFGSSNASLYEHLGSDIVYRDVGGLRAALQLLAPSFFNPMAAGHHYLGLAARVHGEYLTSELVNLKKLFYVLRPLAACRWIAQHASMPPTRFADVLAGIDLDARQRGWIDALWAQKELASERTSAPLDPQVRAWIDDWLARCREEARALPRRSGDGAELDRLLARTVLSQDHSKRNRDEPRR